MSGIRAEAELLLLHLGCLGREASLGNKVQPHLWEMKMRCLAQLGEYWGSVGKVLGSSVAIHKYKLCLVHGCNPSTEEVGDRIRISRLIASRPFG